MISAVSTQRRVGVKQHAEHLVQILRAQANDSQCVNSPSRCLRFEKWTERVVILIDTLAPSRQVRALRFESELNE